MVCGGVVEEVERRARRSALCQVAITKRSHGPVHVGSDNVSESKRLPRLLRNETDPAWIGSRMGQDKRK